jgi:hypothetical protein
MSSAHMTLQIDESWHVVPVPVREARACRVACRTGGSRGGLRFKPPIRDQLCQRRFLFLQSAVHELSLEFGQMRTEQSFITADIAPMCSDAESVYILHILSQSFPVSTPVGARMSNTSTHS